MIYKLLVIGDIHFGYYPAKLLYEEFKLVIDNITNDIDAIMIAGDYFDTKLTLSSKHSLYAIKAFCDIINKCEQTGTKIRMIRGTASHDPENQLVNLANIAKSSKADFKLYNTVGEEELFPDFNVLYIPEEYMENKDEYYKEFFNKKYQCIIGHGMFEETNFVVNKSLNMKKYPVFNSEFMENLCEGPIIFGHIHKSQLIRNRIMYTGSFTRSRYGEEEDKGFIITTYETDTNEYEFKFIVNEKATKYDTITIDNKSDIFSMLLNEQIHFIKESIKKYKKDKLRIKIIIPDDYDNTKAFIDSVTTVFGNIENVDIVISDNSKEITKQKTKEIVDKLMMKYNFIFDKNISYEEKIQQYIYAKKGYLLDIENVRKIINGNVK
jgi:DNA repair exonuclease SbcCD nuclease subunit